MTSYNGLWLGLTHPLHFILLSPLLLVATHLSFRSLFLTHTSSIKACPRMLCLLSHLTFMALACPHMPCLLSLQIFITPACLLRIHSCHQVPLVITDPQDGFRLKVDIWACLFRTRSSSRACHKVVTRDSILPRVVTYLSLRAPRLPGISPTRLRLSIMEDILRLKPRMTKSLGMFKPPRVT
jgi:hypothetical protein